MLSTVWNVICLFTMIGKSKLNTSMAAEYSKCLQSKLMQSSVEHFIIQASVLVDQLLMKPSSSEGLLGKLNGCFYFCKWLCLFKFGKYSFQLTFCFLLFLLCFTLVYCLLLFYSSAPTFSICHETESEFLCVIRHCCKTVKRSTISFQLKVV